MRIVTWNSQGYKFGEEIPSLIKAVNPDVLALQECGDIKNIANDWLHIDGIHPFWQCGWNGYNVFYYGWRGCSRCSMATLVREGFEYFKPNCMEAVVPRDDRSYQKDDTETEGDDYLRKGLRAILRLNVIVDGIDYYVCNVHLPSGNPVFARKVGYAYIDCSLPLSSNMIMVGDFNTGPGTWLFNNSSLRVVNPGSRTHESGNELDYAITNISGRIDVTLAGGVVSDHYPVQIDI